MKVLSLDQITLKMLGIISSKGKSYYTRMIISQYVCLITPILFLIPLITFFLMNFSDVAQATSAFYLICIVGMGFVTYSEFWIKRSTALSIIDQIQKIVNDSAKEFKRVYQKTELIAYNVVHYFKIFVFCSVFGVVSVPLCILIFLWITDDYLDEMRLLPAALQ